MEKRLLFFASDFEIGLTQANTEVVSALWQSEKVDMLCLTSEKEQEPGLHRKLDEAGVKKCVIEGLDVHDHFRDKVRALRAVVSGHGITHANVQNNWQLALAVYVKYRYVHRLKIIYTIHGYRHNSPLKAVLAIGMIGMALLLFTDRVISMSSYVSRRFWFLGYKTDVVFYLMNKPQYAKTTNRIIGSPLRLVFPAQFRKGKNQQILISAIKQYVDQTHDLSIRLYLPGAGPRLDAMKVLARQLGVEQQVVFPGKLNLDGVFALYEESNIALCASNVETYGRCIAEPFMLGRCVVTHKTGVAIDIIRDRENGVFFCTDKDLAALLTDFHAHPEKVVAMANQAFVDRQVFSTENVLRSYLSVINKV